MTAIPNAREVLASTPAPREVRTERIFEASRERVWQALTEPALLAQWWGRGNPLQIERFEPFRGGHWRFVEHTADGAHGFEGRFREVNAPERIVQTFEWDGAPGQVVVVTTTLESLGAERTKLVTLSLFFTEAERDDMMSGGMTIGLAESYRALDAVLSAEKELRREFSDWSRSTQSKDLDALMAKVAADVVSYEHETPLQVVGVQAVREVCRRGLDAAAQVSWDVPDLQVLVRGDLAATWGLNRMQGETRDGKPFVSWSRGTRIFLKKDGRWLMIHQHVSFPFEPATGQVKTDLSP
jgi:uncharacterized protein YndB with AHSA1/START domain/ketosteroid isomerase-like protein